MDFTLSTYKRLLDSLQAQEYSFQTFESFIAAPALKAAVLRHDVDRLPGNALKMACLEHEQGIPATYYFRAVPASWNENTIRKISSLGHEIGYHYENLSICKGNTEQALADFKSNLTKLRALARVKTICMHGSPFSRHDNRDMWKHCDYRDFGISGEPYFDLDFGYVFYLTDTGRMWNNAFSSVRDRVDSGFDIAVASTFHLIELAGLGKLPDKIMLNVHPQRWHDRPLPWMRELVSQRIKNGVKYVLIKYRRKATRE